MIGSAGGTIELFTRFETHGNVAFTAQFDDFLKTRAGGAFDDEDAVERARGAECFPDGMDSRDRSHYDKGTLMSAHENLPVPPALEIPDKLYFRIGDVARLAGIKPYVLRFWETERNVATPSAEQVRRPIFHDALKQWRHYEPWLGPLQAALGQK